MDVNKPAIPQSGGSLHKFDLCSLEYNDCDPDEHTSTFNSSAEFKPDVSDLTSENSSKCKASRVMDEGNSEHLDAESPLKVRQEPKLVTSELYLPGGAFSMENSRIPSLSSCRQSNSELQEAKFAEQSQNRELQLQGAANFPQPVIQHHGNAQEMRSSSLNLDLTNSKSDLDTDLPVVTEYNEESGQAHRPCHDVDGYIF